MTIACCWGNTAGGVFHSSDTPWLLRTVGETLMGKFSTPVTPWILRAVGEILMVEFSSPMTHRDYYVLLGKHWWWSSPLQWHTITIMYYWENTDSGVLLSSDTPWLLCTVGETLMVEFSSPVTHHDYYVLLGKHWWWSSPLQWHTITIMYYWENTDSGVLLSNDTPWLLCTVGETLMVEFSSPVTHHNYHVLLGKHW